MPEFLFHLHGLIQTLDNDTLLGEVFLSPELSCLADDRVALCDALEQNARVIVESVGPEEVYRRRSSGMFVIEDVLVTLQAPAWVPAWREPVALTLPAVRWAHDEHTFLAYLPTLGIEVVAPTAAELERLLPLHVRACLMRGKRLALHHLARLQRCRKLETETLSCPVKLLTPRQKAEEALGDQGKESKTLKEVGTDLTLLTLPEAFEVEETVARVAEVLTAKSPRSVLLVGASGVGKTAIVQELVRRRQDFGLGHTPFWATSGARLVAGQCGFGMWQERVQELWREASKARAILHVGNLMELLDVGKSEFRSQGIASFLRPYLIRGDLLVVAECLPEQKPLIERQDPHLLQAFVEVPVAEPSRERGRAILTSCALAAALARPAGSELPLDGAALETLDALHRRYATYSAYPGRPIRFLRNLLMDLPPYRVLTGADVTAGFSRETGLPVFLLEDSIPLDLDQARAWFAGRVIGQDEAVDLVVELLATVKARLTRPRKPIASLLFIGPTGVGKTEMAKTLAEFLFGSRERLTRYDMSEYADPLAVQRLIGGSGAGEGLLTARVREQPFSVVLLDEFEKADPQLFDLLLQVLGEGRLTDASGRLADFCNSVVIMTSNLGAVSYQQGDVGFAGASAGAEDNETRSRAKEHFLREVRAFVRPELFNRIDRIVPFAPLAQATILHIAQRQLDLLRLRDGIRHRGVALDVAGEVSGWLAEKGFDARYGARPLKRAVERELLAPLAEAMNQYTAETPLRAVVTLVEDILDIKVRARTDETGRQVAAHGADATAATVARGAVEMRRDLQALQRCSSMREVVNEIFRLERIEKRLRQGKPVARYEELESLGRLPHYRKLRDDMDEQMRVGCTREDEGLVGLYGEEPADVERLAESLAGGRKRFGGLLRELYVQRFDNPNEVTVAVFSEEPERLWELTAAYARIVAQLNGALDLWQFLPEREGRGQESSPERRRILDTARALEGAENVRARWWDRQERTYRPGEARVKTREGVIGLALEVRAPLAFALFVPEAGVHQVIAPRGGRCLVDVSSLRMTGAQEHTFYMPPQGIERRGMIGSQPKRRIVYTERGLVEDLALDRKLSWDGHGLAELLLGLMEERLQLSARELLNE